MSPLTHLV